MITAATYQGPRAVTVTMSREEAKRLLREMDDLAQAFPSSLLTGSSPFAQVYRELRLVLEGA